MAEYTSKLTPDLINLNTEASMDTSLLNGKSVQRTVNVLDVINGDGTRKQISSVKDGDSFDDVVDVSSTSTTAAPTTAAPTTAAPTTAAPTTAAPTTAAP